MANAANGLRIKYGMESQPTEQQVNLWAQTVIQLINKGSTQEQAGAEAAKKIFPDFGRMIYASEADTIEALLRAAGER